MPQQTLALSPGEVWSRHSIAAGGEDASSAASGRDLDARYAEPHRRYHVAGHVTAVLRDSALLADELDGVDRDALALAACAHDVVYAGRAGEDEQASADWARDALHGAGVPAATAQRVRALVLATATHSCPSDDPTAVALLDADLAILGSAPAEYARYLAAVRAEYAAVPEDAWRTGRAGVLAHFLERAELFRSTPARERWGAAARRNLSAELASLEAAR